MSLDDAYRLTLSEFDAIYNSWHEMYEMSYRNQWEQARFIAHCSVMPHAKRGLKPTDIVLFEWEKETEEEGTICTREDFERIRQRFEIQADKSTDMVIDLTESNMEIISQPPQNDDNSDTII